MPHGTAAYAVDPEDPAGQADEPARASPKKDKFGQCACYWNGYRAQFMHMPLLILAMAVCTYGPVMDRAFRPAQQRSSSDSPAAHFPARPEPSPTEVALAWALTAAIALMFISYFQAMLTDPGTVSQAWSDDLQADSARRSTLRARYCHKSEKWKPERAHYCRITERLILNMDHFCPSVVNDIGYHNRKFFMLFLVYTVAAALLGLGTLIYEGDFQFGHKLEHNFPAFCVVCMGAILDVVMALLLAPFLCWHLKMAAYNETTIEQGYTAERFDIGWWRNLKQVFGSSVVFWLLPIYACGPDGDGLTWVHDYDVQYELTMREAAKEEQKNRAAEEAKNANAKEMKPHGGKAVVPADGSAAKPAAPVVRAAARMMVAEEQEQDVV